MFDPSTSSIEDARNWVLHAKRHHLLSALSPELVFKNQLNLQDQDGMTQFHRVVSHGSDDMVQLFLNEADVDVFLKSYTGIPPVLTVLKRKNIKFFNTLLQRLEAAPSSGNYDVIVKMKQVRTRIRNNYSVGDIIKYNVEYKPDGKTSTLLCVAAGMEDPSFLNSILNIRKTININLQEHSFSIKYFRVDSKNKMTALFIAAKHGHEKNVQLLLKYPEININLGNDSGMSPLSIAASKGHINIFRLLLERPEIDINASGSTVLSEYKEYNRNCDNMSSTLYLAAEHGCDENLRLLLDCEHNLDVNIGNHFTGNTPLSVAAAQGNMSAVKMLLNQPGIDVHRTGTHTPFSPIFGAAVSYYSSSSGDKTNVDSYNLVSQLLDHDGTIDIDTQYKGEEKHTISFYSVIKMAVQNDNVDLVCLLLNHGDIDMNQLMFYDIDRYSEPEEPVPDNGYSLLHLACQHEEWGEVQNDNDYKSWNTDDENVRFVAMVSILLKNGCPLDVNTKLGFTPLTLAAKYEGNSAIIRHFLDNGADFNKQDGNGRTMLVTAAETNNQRVLGVLLKHEAAKSRIVNTKHLVMALRNEHFDTVLMLLQHGHGHGSVSSWFSWESLKYDIRYKFYKIATEMALQHQSLLDFHMCRLIASNAVLTDSPLRVFKSCWPPLVSEKIASYTIPSKAARQILTEVVICYLSTLNDVDKREQTQLCAAIEDNDISMIDFLLDQDQICINQLSSQYSVKRTGRGQLVGKWSPLSCAMARLHRGAHHQNQPRTRILQKISIYGGIEMVTHHENEYDY